MVPEACAAIRSVDDAWLLAAEKKARRRLAAETAHMRADFLTKALPVGAFRANAALVYPEYEYAPL